MAFQLSARPRHIWNVIMGDFDVDVVKREVNMQ